jgi:hypothetical protein
MVGREDERVFMLAAGWWSAAGLILSLIGILLLFQYGMPYRARAGGRPVGDVTDGNPRSVAVEPRYEKLGWLGVLLIVIGTICQIVGAYLSASS